MTRRELVGQAGGAVGADEAPVAVGVPETDAAGAVGLAVTVTVLPAAVGVLAEDAQPATAATQVNAAAAMTSRPAQVLGSTHMPFTRVAARVPFSHYDDVTGAPVGAPDEVGSVLVWVTGAVTHVCVR